MAMGNGMAAWIFKTIDSDEWSEKVKRDAIRQVINFETISGIKKNEMLAVMRFLYQKAYGEKIEHD